MSDYEELRRLAERATPGTWWLGRGWEQGAPGYFIGSTAHRNGIIFDPEDFDSQVRPEDAEYMAAAHPEVVLALLDKINALQQEVQDLRVHAVEYQRVGMVKAWDEGFNEGWRWESQLKSGEDLGATGDNPYRTEDDE